MMKTILVTGAGGYIGSVLVPKLLGKGYKVTALDRYFFGTHTLAPHRNLTMVREDTRRLTESHFAGIDAVIDLAAISNDPSGELFQEETYQINFTARVNTATLARKAGVRRYILPSSCSVYGFHDPDVMVDETSPLNPLTTYAKANEKAEEGILPLAGGGFVVTVIRQATVFGYSPRMRFDLAVNAMVHSAWEKGIIPLNGDGTQWRPFVHIQDTTDAMLLLLETDPDKINGEIFNIGSTVHNYQLKDLADEVAQALPVAVEIERCGDPDRRSYRVSCDKITSRLGWRPHRTVRDGAMEVYDALFTGKLARTEQTITLNWYQELTRWHRIIKELEMHGGMISL
jgi:nucleoside-diphosphate-sugar epimerase